jgi:hypothetical protein
VETIQLLGTAMGLGFVSGLNLYATVLAVGLGVNLGLIQLAPHLEGVAVLGHPLVIVVAGFLYTVEFFADKVPWLDSAWDALHTFIRPLGAAWIGATALGEVHPALDVAAFLLAGGVAFSTHATKAGVRLVVNSSPEPFSNVALSLTEDVVAVGGAWLALAHPLVAGAIAAAFVLAVILLGPRLLRLLRVQLLAMAALARAWLGRERAPDDLFDDLPAAHAAVLPAAFGKPGDFAVRCTGGRAIGARAGELGYLCLAGDRLVFLARRGLRVREHPVDLASVQEIRTRPGFLFDRLTLRAGGRTAHFSVFRDHRPALPELVARLESARASTPR